MYTQFFFFFFCHSTKHKHKKTYKKFDLHIEIRQPNVTAGHNGVTSSLLYFFPFSSSSSSSSSLSHLRSSKIRSISVSDCNWNGQVLCYISRSVFWQLLVWVPVFSLPLFLNCIRVWALDCRQNIVQQTAKTTTSTTKPKIFLGRKGKQGATHKKEWLALKVVVFRCTGKMNRHLKQYTLSTVKKLVSSKEEEGREEMLMMMAVVAQVKSKYVCEQLI